MISLRTIRSASLMLCAFFAISTLASMTSPVSASTTAPRDAATLKVKVAPSVVTHGKPIAIRGGSGSVGRKPVSVLFRDAGTSSWGKLKTIKSDAQGFYSTGVTARESGQYKVRTVNGESPSRAVRVRSTLRVTGIHRYVKLGRKIGIRGVVRPAGVRRIKIVITGAGKTIRTKTKKHGGFSARWTPRTSGTYRVRVYSANNEIATGDRSHRFKVFGLRPSGASYFGPGLFGNPVACGGTLSPGTVGVAHKTLPCGTKVTIRYHGKTVTVPVIDRGPYIAGRDYDLTQATRNRLGFGGVGTIWTNH